MIFSAFFVIYLLRVYIHSRLHEGAPFKLVQASNGCLRVCGITTMTGW